MCPCASWPHSLSHPPRLLTPATSPGHAGRPPVQLHHLRCQPRRRRRPDGCHLRPGAHDERGHDGEQWRCPRMLWVASRYHLGGRTPGIGGRRVPHCRSHFAGRCAACNGHACNWQAMAHRQPDPCMMQCLSLHQNLDMNDCSSASEAPVTMMRVRTFEVWRVRGTCGTCTGVAPPAMSSDPNAGACLARAERCA